MLSQSHQLQFIDSGGARVTVCVIKFSVVLHRAPVPCTLISKFGFSPFNPLTMNSGEYWPLGGGVMASAIKWDTGSGNVFKIGCTRAPYYSILALTVRGGDISHKVSTD